MKLPSIASVSVCACVHMICLIKNCQIPGIYKAANVRAQKTEMMNFTAGILEFYYLVMTSSTIIRHCDYDLLRIAVFDIVSVSAVQIKCNVIQLS